MRTKFLVAGKEGYNYISLASEAYFPKPKRRPCTGQEMDVHVRLGRDSLLRPCL